MGVSLECVLNIGEGSERKWREVAVDEENVHDSGGCLGEQSITRWC